MMQKCNQVQWQYRTEVLTRTPGPAGGVTVLDSRASWFRPDEPSGGRRAEGESDYECSAKQRNVSLKVTNVKYIRVSLQITRDDVTGSLNSLTSLFIIIINNNNNNNNNDNNNLLLQQTAHKHLFISFIKDCKHQVFLLLLNYLQCRMEY